MDDLGVEWIAALANKIYDEGHFPLDMRRLTYVALHKKPETAKCELFCTIGLMIHITKVILNMLICRMRGQTKGETSEEQFGFAEDKRTRNAIVMLRMIGERCIDCVKAFDKVQHKRLFRIL